MGKADAHRICGQEAADGLKLSHRPHVERGKPCFMPDPPWFLGRAWASHVAMSPHRLPGGLANTSLIQVEFGEFRGWLI